jgi:hypothetical protein
MLLSRLLSLLELEEPRGFCCRWYASRSCDLRSNVELLALIYFLAFFYCRPATAERSISVGTHKRCSTDFASAGNQDLFILKVCWLLGCGKCQPPAWPVPWSIAFAFGPKSFFVGSKSYSRTRDPVQSHQPLYARSPFLSSTMPRRALIFKLSQFKK